MPKSVAVSYREAGHIREFVQAGGLLVCVPAASVSRRM